MKELIELAEKGRLFWLDLVEEYHINSECQVVIIPDNDLETQKIALKYLPQYLKNKYAKRGIVLMPDDILLKADKEINSSIEIKMCKKADIEAIMKFYCLYEFASNLVVASLKYPPGRKGMGIVGHKGLSYEEVFAGVVYGIMEEA